MATSYTTFLGLALPVTGELSGTWGDTVNNYISNYLDAAIAGAQTVTTDTTLTKTTGSSLGSTSSQYAIIIASPASANITITAPAASKIYTIINTSGTYTVKIVGAGPTTGVTLGVSEKAQVAWNGSDFVRIGASGGPGVFSSITNTGLTSGRVVYSTTGGLETDSANLLFNGTTLTANTLNLTNALGTTYGGTGLTSFTANGVVYASSSSALTTGSALTFDGTNLGLGVTPSAWSLASTSALQVRQASLFGYLNNSYIQSNAYFNSGWKYIASDYAQQYIQASGQHQFFTAPSGTAGNAITFTQAMTLDASGNLFLGSTTAPFASSGRTYANINGSSQALLGLTVGGVDKAYLYADGTNTTLSNSSVSGSLIFATNAGTERARIDTSGNLGIGTSSPAYKLDVADASSGIRIGSNVAGYRFYRESTGGNAGYLQFYGSQSTYIGYIFGGVDGERARIDTSGNLGLGVTPSAWTTTAKVAQFGNAAFVGGYIAANSWATVNSNAYYNSSANPIYTDTDFASSYWQYRGEHRFYTAPSGTAGNAITFTQAMTLDASGNFFVGTTSQSGGSNITFNQPANADMKIAASASTATRATYQVFVNTTTSTFGTENSTGGSLVSGSSAYASVISNGGAYPIQFGTNNTVRATLDSSGNLLVGTTSSVTGTPRAQIVAPASVAGLVVQNQTSTNDCIVSWNTATSGNNTFVGFYTEASITSRGSITYNRAGGLVVYNTTSDYRAKDIIGPVQDSGATIDALKVYEGKMKGATQSRPMLVAHEAQAITPYAVTGEKDAVKEDGTPDYQQMDVSSLVPLLIAEIQSLRIRIAQLEAK